jgi:hypothetical protein
MLVIDHLPGQYERVGFHPFGSREQQLSSAAIRISQYSGSVIKKS